MLDARLAHWHVKRTTLTVVRQCQGFSCCTSVYDCIVPKFAPNCNNYLKIFVKKLLVAAAGATSLSRYSIMSTFNLLSTLLKFNLTSPLSCAIIARRLRFGLLSYAQFAAHPCAALRACLLWSIRG